MAIKPCLCLEGSGGDWSPSIVRSRLALRPCDSESQGYSGPIKKKKKKRPSLARAAEPTRMGRRRKRCGRRGPVGRSSRLRGSPLQVTHPRQPRGRGTCWVGADLQACTHRVPRGAPGVPFADSWPPPLQDPGGTRAEEGWEVGFSEAAVPSRASLRGSARLLWSRVLPELPALPTAPEPPAFSFLPK